MLFRVSHATLLFLVSALVTTTASTVQGQKTGTLQGGQLQEIEVERAHLHQYREISARPVSERRELFVQASAPEKSALWRIHLAFSLVNRPGQNREQRDVILDAISMSTPEFFSISNENPTWKAKVDGPLQSLMQRALIAFPKKEAAGIFANIGSDQGEGTLLERYLAIAALSIPERKVLFAKVSDEDKSDLWKFHLALYFVKRSNVNEEQREVLFDTISLATPEFFSLTSENPLWKTQVDKPLQSLAQRALVVFTKREGIELFNMLGGPVSYADGIEPDPEPGRKCNCSHDSDWCWEDCYSTVCTHTTSGCGTLWQYACTGLCW